MPPCRSRPSLGFQLPSAATAMYMMAMTSPKTSSVRVGLDDLVATSVLSCVVVAGGCRLSRYVVVAVERRRDGP